MLFFFLFPFSLISIMTKLGFLTLLNVCPCFLYVKHWLFTPYSFHENTKIHKFNVYKPFDDKTNILTYIFLNGNFFLLQNSTLKEAMEANKKNNQMRHYG
jgi:hypothetical protein